eukprot:691492-Amphidinium_carterae.2
MTFGMEMHEHKKRVNYMHEDKNKIDHDMKEQHHHFMVITARRSRLEATIDEKYYMEMVKTQRHYQRHHQQEFKYQHRKHHYHSLLLRYSSYDRKFKEKKKGSDNEQEVSTYHLQDQIINKIKSDRLLKREEEERVRLREEELQRQAAQQGVPEERVHQAQEVHVEVPEVPPRHPASA